VIMNQALPLMLVPTCARTSGQFMMQLAIACEEHVRMADRVSYEVERRQKQLGSREHQQSLGQPADQTPPPAVRNLSAQFREASRMERESSSALGRAASPR
jgi:hypothetical protein